MLINQGIVSVVLQKFDWDIQFIFVVYVVVQGGYFWVVCNGVCLVKVGDGGFNGIFQDWQMFNGNGVSGFVCVVIIVMNVDVVGQNW